MIFKTGGWGRKPSDDVIFLLTLRLESLHLITLGACVSTNKTNLLLLRG